MNDYLDRLEDQLAELTRQGAHVPATAPRLPRSRVRPAIVPALGVMIALGVALVVLLFAHSHAPSQRAQPAAPAHLDPAVRSLVASMAVLRRPQTATDRSLATVVAQAVRRGRLGRGSHDQLGGSIPSLTRYAETLPDGREVFLVVYDRPPGPVRRHAPHNLASLGLVIVSPDGSWRNGQPVSWSAWGATPGSLYLAAASGPSCDSLTHYSVVPDRVSRVRWQFARQDQYGYVYRSPLTVDVPVRGNVAAAAVPSRATCDQPAVVTLYGRHGQVLSRHGDPASLNEIGRPIRHGTPPTGLPGPGGHGGHELFVLSGDGIGIAHFGEPAAKARRAVTTLIGRPPLAPYSAGFSCDIDHLATWSNVVLYFRSGRLAGYMVGRGDGAWLATVGGLSPGDVLAYARDLYRHALHVARAPGNGWSAMTATGRLFGVLGRSRFGSGQRPVETIEAGDVGCT